MMPATAGLLAALVVAVDLPGGTLLVETGQTRPRTGDVHRDRRPLHDQADACARWWSCRHHAACSSSRRRARVRNTARESCPWCPAAAASGATRRSRSRRCALNCTLSLARRGGARDRRGTTPGDGAQSCHAGTRKLLQPHLGDLIGLVLPALRRRRAAFGGRCRETRREREAQHDEKDDDQWQREAVLFLSACITSSPESA